MLSGKRRPTIRDVAKAAEVSVGTVSAVLNGSVRVNEATRDRIQQCIGALGYEPNTAARSLKRQRSSSIGLIVPDLQNPFFAAVAEGAHFIAQRHDVLMVLGTTGAESRWEEYYAQTLRARRLDGMILLSGSGKPNVGLVNEGCGLERLTRLLLCHPLGREPAQLVVDQRQELRRGTSVASLDGVQDVGHFIHLG